MSFFPASSEIDSATMNNNNDNNNNNNNNTAKINSLLPVDPVTPSTLEYDFEEYALKHGIPETLDPLPYRKAGSVFATGEEAEPVLTSAKHDPRLRTVVCRHWLRDLCMKGSACEYVMFVFVWCFVLCLYSLLF